MQRTTEEQTIRLITASLLLIAADHAPSDIRKNLCDRGRKLLAEADEPPEVRQGYETTPCWEERSRDAADIEIDEPSSLPPLGSPQADPPRFETDGAAGPML